MSDNSLSQNVGKLFEVMFKKSLYKVAMIILGLPIMIVTFFKYLSEKNKNSYAGTIKSIEDELTKDGTKENLRGEIEKQQIRKLEFFNKNLGEAEFTKNVDELLATRFKEIVEIKLKSKHTELKDVTFTSTFRKMIENQGMFILSIILGFPMYILLAICSNSYVKYIFERLVMMVFVIFGVTLLVFTILYSSPLDPAVNILGQGATPDQVAEFNRIYGLDQPYLIRLMESFKGLFTFDLGNSFTGNEEVFGAIMRRFPVTLNVAFVSLGVAIILSIPAGIISAIKQYSAYDYTFMLLALLGLSIPNFWLGLILILKFSIESGILPATYQVGNGLSLIMPAIVLGTGLSASVARMTRSSMLEVVNQDYILTARAKGLSESKVIIKHALGNAMIPIVTVIGLLFGGMLGGSAVTEKVFNINGIGSFIVDKQFVPDIPIVLAGVVYVAVIISLINLVVDILYSFLDPRIKSKMKSY
ncbi:MAG: ABC transporter permease [Romboutsia sp.]